MTPTEAAEAAVRDELVRSGMPGRPNGLAHAIVERITDLVRPAGEQGGTSFTRQPIPIPADQPLLALWVHVDLDGRATFGGRMSAADTVTALRFLADQVEAGDVKLGAEQ